ncbi:hypothetical protein JOM56_013893 [Amanita muscaria]
MNTITIHSNIRVRVPTLMHELNAALISPVSKWYRKPTPWWVDGFEEEGFSPIIEEEEEEEEAMIEDEEDIDEEEEDVVLAGDDDVFVDTGTDNNGIPTVIVTSPSDGDLVHLPETVVLEFDHEDIANGVYKDYLLDASLYNWYMRFYSSTMALDTTARTEDDSINNDLQIPISTTPIDEEQDILEMNEVQNMVDADEELVAGAGEDVDEDEVLEMLMGSEAPSQYHLYSSTKTGSTTSLLSGKGTLGEKVVGEAWSG